MADEEGKKKGKGWLGDAFKAVAKTVAFGVASYFLVNMPLDYFFEAIRLPFFHNGEDPLAQAMIHKASEVGGWINDFYGLTGDNFMNDFWHSVLADEIALYETPDSETLAQAFTSKAPPPAVQSINGTSSSPLTSSPDTDDVLNFDYDPDTAFSPALGG